MERASEVLVEGAEKVDQALMGQGRPPDLNRHCPDCGHVLANGHYESCRQSEGEKP